MMVLSNSVKWSNRTQLWHIFLWKVITNHERTKRRWVFEVTHEQKNRKQYWRRRNQSIEWSNESKYNTCESWIRWFFKQCKNTMMKKCSWKYINDTGSSYAVMSVPVIGNLFRSALQWEPPKQVFNYFTKTWGTIRCGITLLFMPYPPQ